MPRLTRLQVWALTVSLLVAVVISVALAIWWGDILQALLDPELPYAVYKPPAAPDYATLRGWALAPAGAARAEDPPADVFFVHPTTFDGGRNWNGPIDDRKANRVLSREMLPNYAGPFASVGRLFAPRYRQASLYTSLTLFDDAIEARQFAYGDILAAFRVFEARLGPARPFAVVSVEQGGTLASRLLREEVETDPGLRRRLFAAYLIEAVEPVDDHPPGAPLPACQSRSQAGCLVAWVSAPWLDLGRVRRIRTRSLVWNAKGALVGLGGRRPLCVNPLTGSTGAADAGSRFNLGAANATGLEWGARPGFMARQVGAKCVDGVLRVTRPRSVSLRPAGDWARRLRAAPYNLFWADLEADARARLATWLAMRGDAVTLPR